MAERERRELRPRRSRGSRDDAFHRAKRGGVTAEDWRKVGLALMQAAVALDQAESPIDRWLMAIGDALALDPIDADILALALHYWSEPHP